VLAPSLAQLQHPVLEALDKGEHSWIKTLLFAFNAGDIGKFESLVPQFQTEVRRVSRRKDLPWSG
jgi:hypothetical protein